MLQKPPTLTHVARLTRGGHGLATSPRLDRDSSARRSREAAAAIIEEERASLDDDDPASVSMSPNEQSRLLEVALEAGRASDA